MKKRMHDDKYYRDTEVVNTKFILNHFNLTRDELLGLMIHGYAHPVIFENESCDLELLFNFELFKSAYDHIDRIKREYEVIQSITEQSE